MTRKPLVSVLLPYRKKDAFLASALASLEKQTYSRIEILMLEDTRVEGITVLLNRLAHRARGEFLARMDADDISEPERIEKQVDFLISHPNVTLVGTWANLIDESGRKMGIQKMPTSWEEIKKQAFFRNPLIHPTWMMRREWYEKIGGYNSLYRFSQDWDLILRRVWYDRIENIPEALIRLRIHRTSSSFSSNKEQLYFGLKARLGALARKEVPIWKGAYLFPKIFSFFIPTSIKFRLKYLSPFAPLSGASEGFRSRRSVRLKPRPASPELRRGEPSGRGNFMNIIGIVLPMGQNRKQLEESGQWSLWQQELEFYQKKFSRVEFFEYHHKDWRRYVEALLLPVIQANRFQRCQVLKAVHLTGVIPCLVARLLYRVPYVLSYGYRYDEFAAVEGKWNVWLLSKLLTPMAIKFANAVMVPTEELKNYVRNFGAKKIEIIPNGVDTRLFSVKTNKLTNEQTNRKTNKTLKKVESRVLFVGRLEKQKNLKTLILAMGTFHEFQKNLGDRGQQNGIPIRLMFVGKGSLERELQILADRLSVNLTIHRPISNEKLPEVYQQADVFVLPSLSEGHPKVLLEAMSCGIPCLASNIPGVNEIIIDGKNGLLVEPTVEGIWGGLQKLISSPELRKRLGREARETVIEKFDKNKLMKKEISLLQSHFELVEKSRPPTAADLYR